MAYKDKVRQREAVKQATQRYRLRLKGITKVSRVTGITLDDEVNEVIPKQAGPVMSRPGDRVCHVKPEPQSHNPMMVGYVPPTD